MRAGFKKFLRNSPWVFGIVLTLGVLYLGYYSSSLPACYENTKGIINCPTKWFYLKQSTPNELGDTLAGFAGTMAFIWIIVTVALQAAELSEQRAELTDQRKATEKMALALEAQAKIETTRIEWEEQKTFDELFEQRLLGLNRVLLSFREHEHTWVLEKSVSVGRDKATKISLISDGSASMVFDDITDVVETHFERLSQIRQAVNEGKISIKPHVEKRFFILIEKLKGLIQNQTSASRAAKKSAGYLGLKSI